MEDSGDFLGVGWTFPPEFDKNTGQVKLVKGELDILQSLQILFTTKIGERIMHPNFGANLDDLQFSPINRTLITYISDRIRTAILYHEPRIDPEKISINQGNIEDGEVIIELTYKIRSTNSRRNMVFPYYILEGTNL
ncbi:hypothetical protein GCM10007049_07460 [Echinicola pacifica]|uniref:IraD/Gp25-like domain-containing protein n=1 Tax=Echinicola pacifica TaxID=346377 RepID=A0A918UK46_9BACT|nr:GPW/gp25 family protein [Echinicola pacifica]GGZ17448.1 hypothetical protein GCM10007049_07460 [Echinicola pacifica]